MGNLGWWHRWVSSDVNISWTTEPLTLIYYLLLTHCRGLLKQIIIIAINISSVTVLGLWCAVSLTIVLKKSIAFCTAFVVAIWSGLYNDCSNESTCGNKGAYSSPVLQVRSVHLEGVLTQLQGGTNWRTLTHIDISLCLHSLYLD